MKIDELLPPGRHIGRATFSGVIEIEEGEQVTVSDAIDGMMPVAELVDWEVDGK